MQASFGGQNASESFHRHPVGRSFPLLPPLPIAADNIHFMFGNNDERGAHGDREGRSKRRMEFGFIGGVGAIAGNSDFVSKESRASFPRTTDETPSLHLFGDSI